MSKPTRDQIRTDDRLMFLDPPCMYCQHLKIIGLQEPDLDGWKCLAFPKGIPLAILTRGLKHTKILQGQEGQFIFESKIYDYYDGKNVITFEGDWVEPED